MIRKFILPFLLTLISISNLAFSQVSAPKYSNEFLNLGAGGRAVGMGNVQAAIANDATAGYWNPAGLLHLKNKFNLVLMHSELFAGIVKNDFASFATPLDSVSAIGVSFIRMGVDDIADTRRLRNEYGYIQYDSIRFFSVADYALVLSYARKSSLLEGLKLGANAKIIHRNVGEFANAWGFGIDAGAQYEIGPWKLGAMAKDITTTFNAWSVNSEQLEDVFIQTGNRIPENSIEVTLPRLVLGGARNFSFSEKFNVLASTDLDLTFDGKRNVLLRTGLISVDPHAGLELSYDKSVYVRAGANNLQKIKKLGGGEAWRVQPNFGLGIATNGLHVDLAISRLSSGLSGVSDNSGVSSVIVSLGYTF